MGAEERPMRFHIIVTSPPPDDGSPVYIGTEVVIEYTTAEVPGKEELTVAAAHAMTAALNALDVNHHLRGPVYVELRYFKPNPEGELQDSIRIFTMLVEEPFWIN